MTGATATNPDTRRALSELHEQLAEADEVTVVRNRFGYEIDGEYFRRVTTFTGGMPKPWLGAWAAKAVAEYAVDHIDAWKALPSRTDQVKLLKGVPWSKRDDAGDRGTAVHNALEAFVRGEAVPEGLTEDEAACSAAAMEFLRLRASRPLAVEMTVFNRSVGYAGTLDLWEIDTNGVTWILDYKTSSGIYPEHAIQQAAYRNAEFAIVQKRPAESKNPDEERWTGKVIAWTPVMAERLGIVHVTPEHARLYPIRYDNRLWTVFRAAAHVKLFQLDTDSFKGKTPRHIIFEEAA